MRNLRVGLIGLGAMGRNHLRVLRQMAGVDVVGIADLNPSSRALHSEVWMTASVDELLLKDLDYCVVATPTSTHEELGLTLASAGIPSLIEKPLASNSTSARRICEAFDAAGLVAAVGHIERFNPALREAQRKIRDGAIGEIVQLATRRQSPFPTRVSDVGVILDLATHDIDLSCWVTQSMYLDVAAHVAHRGSQGREDLVSVSGLLVGGVVISHLVNWLSPFKERCTTITGTEGTLVIDTIMSDLTLFENGVIESRWEDLARVRGLTEGDVHRFAIGKSEPLVTEHEEFRDAVLGRTAEIVPLVDGLRAVVVAEAIAQSAEVGVIVRIDASTNA